MSNLIQTSQDSSQPRALDVPAIDIPVPPPETEAFGAEMAGPSTTSPIDSLSTMLASPAAAPTAPAPAPAAAPAATSLESTQPPPTGSVAPANLLTGSGATTSAALNGEIPDLRLNPTPGAFEPVQSSTNFFPELNRGEPIITPQVPNMPQGANSLDMSGLRGNENNLSQAIAVLPEYTPLVIGPTQSEINLNNYIQSTYQSIGALDSINTISVDQAAVRATQALGSLGSRGSQQEDKPWWSVFAPTPRFDITKLQFSGYGEGVVGAGIWALSVPDMIVQGLGLDAVRLGAGVGAGYAQVLGSAKDWTDNFNIVRNAQEFLTGFSQWMSATTPKEMNYAEPLPNDNSGGFFSQNNLQNLRNNSFFASRVLGVNKSASDYQVDEKGYFNPLGQVGNENKPTAGPVGSFVAATMNFPTWAGLKIAGVSDDKIAKTPLPYDDFKYVPFGGFTRGLLIDIVTGNVGEAIIKKPAKILANTTRRASNTVLRTVAKNVPDIAEVAPDAVKSIPTQSLPTPPAGLTRGLLNSIAPPETSLTQPITGLTTYDVSAGTGVGFKGVPTSLPTRTVAEVVALTQKLEVEVGKGLGIPVQKLTPDVPASLFLPQPDAVGIAKTTLGKEIIDPNQLYLGVRSPQDRVNLGSFLEVDGQPLFKNVDVSRLDSHAAIDAFIAQLPPRQRTYVSGVLSDYGMVVPDAVKGDKLKLIDGEQAVELTRYRSSGTDVPQTVREVSPAPTDVDALGRYFNESSLPTQALLKSPEVAEMGAASARWSATVASLSSLSRNIGGQLDYVQRRLGGLQAAKQPTLHQQVFSSAPDSVQSIPAPPPLRLTTPKPLSGSKLTSSDGWLHGTSVNEAKGLGFDPILGGSRSEVGPAFHLTRDLGEASDAANARWGNGLPVAGKSVGAPAVLNIRTADLKVMDATKPLNNATRVRMTEVLNEMYPGSGLSAKLGRTLKAAKAMTLPEAHDKVAKLMLADSHIYGEGELLNFQRRFNESLRDSGIDAIKTKDSLAVLNMTKVERTNTSAPSYVALTPLAAEQARVNLLKSAQTRLPLSEYLRDSLKDSRITSLSHQEDELLDQAQQIQDQTIDAAIRKRAKDNEILDKAKQIESEATEREVRRARAADQATASKFDQPPTMQEKGCL